MNNNQQTLSQVLCDMVDNAVDLFAAWDEFKNERSKTMNRTEYLQKMQSYREDLQVNAKINRQALDLIERQHVEKCRKENDEYKNLVAWQRENSVKNRLEIERKMHELKLQWAEEHPFVEVLAKE